LPNRRDGASADHRMNAFGFARIVVIEQQHLE
jgi:hypothetical protein